MGNKRQAANTIEDNSLQKHNTAILDLSRVVMGCETSEGLSLCVSATPATAAGIKPVSRSGTGQAPAGNRYERRPSLTVIVNRGGHALDVQPALEDHS